MAMASGRPILPISVGGPIPELGDFQQLQALAGCPAAARHFAKFVSDDKLAGARQQPLGTLAESLVVA